MLVVYCRGYADKVGQPRGISEIISVSIQLVPFEVIAERGAPVGQDFQYVGCRQVEFLLLVVVVDGQLCGVLIDVMGVVIGIFQQPSRAEALTDVFVEVGLDKGIEVTLPFAPSPHVVYDGSRYAA